MGWAKDQELYFTNEFNALNKIITAPTAIMLLSQIVLIAAVAPDFELAEPTSGWKHLEYPDSFKTSLLQLSQSSYDAFNAAHVNMDIIERTMRSMPAEIRFALLTLLTGTEEEIKLVLPSQLDQLKSIATRSKQSA